MADSPWAKLEWMGRPVRVTFANHWPVRYGDYVYDGFDDKGVWVSHDGGWQRYILFYDIDRVQLTTEES